MSNSDVGYKDGLRAERVNAVRENMFQPGLIGLPLNPRAPL